MKTYKARLPGYLFDVFVDAENPQDAQDRIMAGLGISRLPAGTKVTGAPVADEALRYEGSFHAHQSLTVWGLPAGNGEDSPCPPLVTLELPELD